MLIGEYGCGKTTLVPRADPAAGGRALRDRPAHQPELDRGGFPARDPLPARPGDGREEQARAAALALRRVLRQLPRGPRHRGDRGRGAADRGRRRVRGAAAADELPDRRPVPGDHPPHRLAGARRQDPPAQASRPAHLHPLPPQRARRHPHRQLHRPSPEDGRPHRADLHARRPSSSSSTSPRGTPREINNLCDVALLVGFTKRVKEIGEKIIAEVIKDMVGVS